MKKILTVVLVFYFCFLCGNTRVLAEEALAGFSVAPFFQEVILADGQDTAKFSLEVSNSRDFPVIFRLSVLDFGALDESGGVAFLGTTDDLKNKYGLASWMSLDRDAVVVSPGEKQTIQGRIDNKDSLSPGGHYAAVVMKMEDNPGDFSDVSPVSKINITPTVAALIFTRKVGGEIFELNLKETILDKKIFGVPKTEKLRFQNSGNVHIIPRGTIKIINPFGGEIGKGILNGESALILPETFRNFSVDIKPMKLAFWPGKYEVLTEYRYDGKDDFATQKESVFIIPTISIIFVFGLVVAIFLYFKFRLNITRKNKASQ
jgi:hypothetical protein